MRSVLPLKRVARKFAATIFILALAGAGACGSRSSQAGADHATWEQRAGEPPRSDVAVCATTVEMKWNRIVVRSGGCPDGTSTESKLGHNAEVDAAIRSLLPGERTTVETIAGRSADETLTH
jgi:hypothetical protein